MKFTLVFIMLATQLFAQKGLEIEYEEVSIPKFIGKDGKEEKLDDEFIAALSVPKKYVLQIENGRSVFTKVEKVNNEQGKQSVIMYGLISYNSELDFNLNKMRQEWMIEHKKYIVSDTIATNFKYELTQEKSTYLGFPVKQAIISYNKDNKTIIWYAPELPKRFGPKEYINLPGLVLKIENYQNGKLDPSYYMKATNVAAKDHVEFNKLFKAKEITSTDFKKLKEDYNKLNSNEHQGVDKE